MDHTGQLHSLSLSSLIGWLCRSLIPSALGFSISVCSWVLVTALPLTCEIEVGAADKRFSVSDYGAVGDGWSDDTSAFTKAWNDACNTEGSASTITVPEGKKYHLNPINFVGPCKSNINLEISGKIIAPKDPNAWKGYDPAKWLTFEKVNGLNISGPGLFDGYGDGWWNISCKWNTKPGCNKLAPTTLRIEKCNGVSLQNLHFKNSPQVHVTVYGSSDVHLKFLNISAPDESPNTDGIHIHASHAVSVQSSTIGTGDDCISMGDHISNISINDIKCGPGHGISIGSLGRGGNEVSVSNINVKNVHFHGTTNGARIKTWPVGRGRVSQVFFSNLNFTAVKNPIIIDQFYCHTPSACPKTKQEYVAWCHRNANGNEGEPLRIFDIPVDGVGLLHPIIADGEVINPEVTPEWMRQEEEMDEEPDVLVEDPEPMDEEEDDEPEAMEQDGEVAELGLDEEGFEIYLDPELELDSEDERAQAMDSDESGTSKDASEELLDDSGESFDPDWEP
ncbi:probable polygalacturonase At1g80170 [Syzygium oleosum]|uniref:probable polygalacturonase At1g80170 n=1 Tax=Syzygium oleosum TaxID=219896 RepID=UPI0024B9D872|nr:probable polygalacturonase At1g80170 [Syzygium oleosum]